MDPYLNDRKDVVNCCQWLCRHGYFGSLLSAGGNVSVRIPDKPILVITPSGKPYMELSAEEICVVDFKHLFHCSINYDMWPCCGYLG